MFLSAFAANAQDESRTIDSLTQIIDNPGSHDTSVCNAYFLWAEQVYLNDPGAALILCQKVRKIAEENIAARPPAPLKKKYLYYLAEALNNIGYIYGEKGEIQKQSEYYHKSLKIREEIGDKKGIANSLNNIGYIYKNQGDIPKALEYYHKSLKIQEEIGNKKGIANSLNNIGVIYKNQGDIPKGLEYYHKSLKIEEEIGNKKGIAISLNNIGVIYYNQGDIPKALEYYLKSLKIKEEIEDKNGIAESLNNIGAIYYDQGVASTDESSEADAEEGAAAKVEHFTKALEYYHKSLKIREDIGDKSGIANSLNNIGVIYDVQGDIPKGLEYYLKSLKIREEIGDKKGIAGTLKNIGTAELDRGALTEALNYGIRGLQIAQELGSPELIARNSGLLSKVAKKQGNFSQALEMYELHILMRDSINNEKTQKASIKQQFKYDYEKKQAVANAQHQAELEKQEALAAAEEHRQNIIIGSVSGGLGLVILFSFFLFNRFRVIRKQKGVIEEQKIAVDIAYDSLEEKNKEITDSINYAQRIQAAILPPDRIVKQYLKDSFILYKPKDIVAGDFYWIEPYAPPVVGASTSAVASADTSDSEGKEEGIIFAAADCTGHGVPGAMLSMLCNNALNRSVREYGITDPGKILDKTREIIIAEFEKSDEDVKDGMDISLCVLNGKKLLFAGAYNLLWIIRNGEVIEIKGDRQPIGNSDNPLPFTTHLFDLEEGDVFYIFSDGYVDQFGGEKGKKLKAKAFRELLLNISDKPMDAQKVLMDEAFESWRGELEQVDDVCVLGVKV